MKICVGVTQAARATSGAVGAVFWLQGMRKGLSGVLNASGGHLRRLKGDIEHASHEVAVNRYMTPSAKQTQAFANSAFFAAVLIATGVVLSVLFVLINSSP